MNTKIISIILLFLILIISTFIKKTLETFDNHPSPSPGSSSLINNRPVSSDTPSDSNRPVSSDTPSDSNRPVDSNGPVSSDTTTDSISKSKNTNVGKENKETTNFFISSLPNKKFIDKVINKIKDITKKSVTNEIKNNEIVFKIDMKMEDLKEEMKENIILQIRYEILNRLNNELNLSYKPEQISITLSSGSIIISVKILSLDQIDKKSNCEKSPEKTRNYIQIRPRGKTGLYVPTTIIGGVEQEFDGSSSSLGGMSLT